MLPPRPRVNVFPNNARNVSRNETRDGNRYEQQSESDLRAQGLPPRRQLPVPSAHDQRQGASDGRIPQADRVLMRWELKAQPALGSHMPHSSTLANQAWDWASSLGPDSPRWSRFLRVMRVRALAYRKAGYKGDCPGRAMADLARAINDSAPKGVV